MTGIRNWLQLTVIVILLAVACAGCGAAGSSAPAEETITISGAWALYPIMVRWAEEYQKIHPNVNFDISAGGAGKGMSDALAGAVDIGMVSRQIYPEEIEKGAYWVSVTKDAVFLTINEQNPVWDDLHSQGIDRDTLVGIFITGEITDWGEVTGNPNVSVPIHVFTRSDAAGAPATWAEYLGKKQEDLLGVGVYGDPGVLEAVIKDPDGIGYNNLNYAFDFETNLPVTGALVVPIDVNTNGQADPEETCDTKQQAIDAVANGHYPSPPARDLNLVFKGKPTGTLVDFARWILTDGQQYVSEAGYVGLPQQQLDVELKKLD